MTRWTSAQDPFGRDGTAPRAIPRPDSASPVIFGERHLRHALCSGPRSVTTALEIDLSLTNTFSLYQTVQRVGKKHLTQLVLGGLHRPLNVRIQFPIITEVSAMSDIIVHVPGPSGSGDGRDG